MSFAERDVPEQTLMRGPKKWTILRMAYCAESFVDEVRMSLARGVHASASWRLHRGIGSVVAVAHEFGGPLDALALDQVLDRAAHAQRAPKLMPSSDSKARMTLLRLRPRRSAQSANVSSGDLPTEWAPHFAPDARFAAGVRTRLRNIVHAAGQAARTPLFDRDAPVKLRHQ